MAVTPVEKPFGRLVLCRRGESSKLLSFKDKQVWQLEQNCGSLSLSLWTALTRMVATATTISSTTQVWPPEALAMYEPVRELGRGGFGAVVLARKRKELQNGDGPTDSSSKKTPGEEDEFVAMKIVGSSRVTTEELGYAHREFDILAELHHPNIMRLLAHWEPPKDAHKCASVMALSYSKGPTLQKLLSKGGRCSLAFCRVVAAQILDAIAYLHSRAVLHRDIKPDNFIITGASLDQAEIWEDGADFDKRQVNSKPPSYWSTLLQKWHVTLVDFGLARALTPQDLHAPPPVSSGNLDASSGQFSEAGGGSVASTGKLNRSYSRRFSRKLSAVGQRNYAAPEILKRVESLDASGRWTGSDEGSTQQFDVTKTLSNHVSFYGMMADAYSVGTTLKYMVTGAPPGQDVEDLIALDNSPLIVVARLICGACSKKSATGPSAGGVRYRSVADIPAEVVRLVAGLTHYDPTGRTSVRRARCVPWIDDILTDREAPSPDDLNFLNFARGAVQQDAPPVPPPVVANIVIEESDGIGMDLDRL